MDKKGYKNASEEDAKRIITEIISLLSERTGLEVKLEDFKRPPKNQEEAKYFLTEVCKISNRVKFIDKRMEAIRVWSIELDIGLIIQPDKMIPAPPPEEEPAPEKFPKLVATSKESLDQLRAERYLLLIDESMEHRKTIEGMGISDKNKSSKDFDHEENRRITNSIDRLIFIMPEIERLAALLHEEALKRGFTN